MKLYMSPALLILLLGLLTMGHAHANPSVSSDAGQSTDNSESESIKRDKSLSADKSRGNRVTHSDSEDRAREKSLSRSHQKRTGISAEKSNSYSADVSINGLILREFTARYERGNVGAGTAWDYFHTCRPLMNALVDYPVRDWMHTGGGLAGSRTEVMKGGLNGWVQSRPGIVAQVSTDDVYIHRYAQCRMTASYWVAEAANRSIAKSVTSEAEVQQRIRDVFSQMDADEPLFQNLRQRARDVWEQASCSNWLDDWDKFKGPDIQCGVFSYEGNSFTVENRQTLSELAIDGRSYKIAINYSNSESKSEDQSVSADARVSASVRESDSRDHFAEAKRTASMSKSHSMDESSSDKVDRSSGASIQASPKE
jgi:hypothetical protein